MSFAKARVTLDIRAEGSGLGRLAHRWENAIPKAVDCLGADLDELLTCFGYKTLKERTAVRTTNAIERRFREVRHRTRTLGVFRTFMGRIPFAALTHENVTHIAIPLGRIAPTVVF